MKDYIPLKVEFCLYENILCGKIIQQDERLINKIDKDGMLKENIDSYCSSPISISLKTRDPFSLDTLLAISSFHCLIKPWSPMNWSCLISLEMGYMLVSVTKYVFFEILLSPKVVNGLPFVPSMRT